MTRTRISSRPLTDNQSSRQPGWMPNWQLMSSGIGIVWLGVTMVIMAKNLVLNEWRVMECGTLLTPICLRLRRATIKPLFDLSG